jgi:hypothetical protein
MYLSFLSMTGILSLGATAVINIDSINNLDAGTYPLVIT